jgi:mono/diheme cytochrome c family protein
MRSTKRETSSWSIWGYLPVGITVLTVWLSSIGLFAQTPAGSALKLDTGKEIYEAACVGCHGPDGKGLPKTTVGFDAPSTFPDFTDCKGMVRERNFDWRATIHEGGPGRGFSEIMPSFADALTLEQIDKVMGYLRGLCTESAWPRGELNLPRALVTEKAFPEDETVITTEINAKGAPGVSNEIVYERRFGVKNQIELAVPFSFQHQASGSWLGGVGDLALGLKRAMWHSMTSGSIFSLQGEVALPTGNKERGLGSGVTTFETFASFGQILPRMGFVQIQAGAELPTHTDDASKAVFWRAAVGKTFAQNQGFGRIWTPMVEFLADRDLETGAKTNWDILPQFQVSLSKRQHILANLGVRFPVTDAGSRATQVVFYLLWDWFDGGLREGWK